jgi:hypothetical protein
VLDTATAETFKPHVGEVFKMRVDESVNVDARLVEVQEAQWAFSPEKRRTPFSLYFQTAAQQVLPQRMYDLEHPALGHLEIFLVPTARNSEGVRYEAVFN